MNIKKTQRYKAWKFHFAIIILSMVFATLIVSIGMLMFGFDPFWLLLIPLMPPLVYAIGALIGVCICEGGAAIGMLLWAFVKYLYNEINIETDIDRDFYWPEYFWLAFCWLSFGLLTVLVTIIIIGGIYKLITIGRFFIQLN